VVTVKD
jgi:hypothetical protein